MLGVSKQFNIALIFGVGDNGVGFKGYLHQKYKLCSNRVFFIVHIENLKNYFQKLILNKIEKRVAWESGTNF